MIFDSVGLSWAVKDAFIPFWLYEKSIIMEIFSCKVFWGFAVWSWLVELPWKSEAEIQSISLTFLWKHKGYSSLFFRKHSAAWTVTVATVSAKKLPCHPSETKYSFIFKLECGVRNTRSIYSLLVKESSVQRTSTTCFQTLDLFDQSTVSVTHFSNSNSSNEALFIQQLYRFKTT